jgi:hypothetical protein
MIFHSLNLAIRACVDESIFSEPSGEIQAEAFAPILPNLWETCRRRDFQNRCGRKGDP